MAGRLTQIAQGSSTVQLGYDANNRRTSLTLPNGVAASYAYDAASELTGISYAQGASTLGNVTYDYDNAGRRTVVGGSLANINLPQPLVNATYNVENQLTQFGTAQLTYDANGNLTSDGSHLYTWDARNHLAAIDNGGTASFIYDAFGRRISKTVYGVTTGYLYDGADIVQEQNGGLPSANLLSGGTDEVFTRTDSAGPLNYLLDGLGSITALTDASGAIQGSTRMSPMAVPVQAATQALTRISTQGEKPTELASITIDLDITIRSRNDSSAKTLSG